MKNPLEVLNIWQKLDFRKSFVLGMIALVVLSFVAGCIGGETQTPGAQTSAPAETYELKMATFYLAGDPGFEIAQHFADEVEKMSNGRIKIEVYQAGELGFPVTEIVDSTANGVVDIAIFYSSYLASQDPVLALAGGKPGPISNPYELFYQVKTVEDLIQKSFEKFGVVYIGPMIYGEPEILVSRVPINRLSDLNGKILRSSGLAAVFYNTLGAQAMMMASGELYQALQLGTIDGLEWTDYTADYKMGFHEVAKYVLEPTPGVNLHSEAAVHAFLIVNPDLWNKLPDDLKEIIKVASRESYLWGSHYVNTLNREYRQKWIEAGATLVKLPPEDNQKIIETAIQLHVEYAKKSPEAQEYISRLVKVWRDLGHDEWADALEAALG
ncbi:TRAP transporter substrate-binding protein [Thermococcus sibiricus]|uniref:TRAP dicarboxylate transporter-DctP subunit n=1 Tax=Thermococcus sibiricus TaxID=172049 RepID=A0A101ENC8_9EURY|nr:TRAP transporter substrate-binding protein [Thermococcus sibiricus]KUK18558.1 MAG: TRAP dicarboxylate transporter-DctP subunit [Thermococcus sibiricus]KUK29431.1 MAG: TRAP dicarboxylate transporter-DctP subunit [Thermococcus sp. 40_45]